MGTLFYPQVQSSPPPTRRLPMRRLLTHLSLLFFLAFLPSAAQEGDPMPGGAGTPEDRTMSPYFLVRSDTGVTGEDEAAAADGFPLKQTRVGAAVSGVVAEVKVTQVYANFGKRPINARYVFPASTRAAIHGMTMTIG